MNKSETKEPDGTQMEKEEFVPFIINKRPKHDVSSPIPPEPKNVNITVNKPNAALFENMEIDGDNNEEMESEEMSPSMRRMVAALDYYNALMTASESDEMDPKLREEFINFCDEHYGEQMMLEDYMHCVEHHGDRESIAKMAAALKCKCSVGSKRCGGIRRHFRDRTTSLEPIHFYVDIMDTMHFNVLHLEDVGLRVNLDLKSESTETEDNLVDDYMLKISRTIWSKRDQHFVDRLDDTQQNGKFTLCSNLSADTQIEEGITSIDRLTEGILKQFREGLLRKQKEKGRVAKQRRMEMHKELEQLMHKEIDIDDFIIQKRAKKKKSKALSRFKAFFSKKEKKQKVSEKMVIPAQNENISENTANYQPEFDDQHDIEFNIRNFQKFQEAQQYDTDALHEDMKMFGEEGHSNVAEKFKNDQTFFILFRKMLRYLRVSGSSFSTGKWFMYWDWYRTEWGRECMMRDTNWNNIDFGGHSLESLCVYPHFKNLEEEVLSSGLITKENWLEILEKAARFMKTSRCKKMKSNGWGDDRSGLDGLHYDILSGTAVSLHHLIALLLYTDSSAFCTALSETFRAIFGGESIEEINKRNSRFYWSSRYLRELVTCFGFSSCKEKRPFWSGISFPLQIPQFQIGLIGPTSTSMAREVALRFAGEQGMMIKLKGGYSQCFNAVPFSCYPEEEERIFCGSTDREELVSIVVVETAKNYKAALSAFTQFDAIFSGNKITKVDEMKMSYLDLEIIKESLRWIEGGEDAVNHKKLDLFILETFYSFILHKKMVSLDLDWMNRQTSHFNKGYEIVKLVMNPLRRNHLIRLNGNVKTKDSNWMKPFVFNLFRHVHTIRIDAVLYPFDFLSFLRLLQSVDLPETLRLIFIEDAGGKMWLEEAFNKVKEEYTAANIEYEMDEYGYCLSLKF